MATIEIINKALAVMNNHDWYWMMADYTHPAIDEARGSMRYFVELVALIKDTTIEKALRELWKATYENVHANLWSKDEEANKQYEMKKAKLMAIILPSGNGQRMAA
ncbi:hypothetical protein M3090_03645 [Bacteroides sp. ET71]|uniref:hypothetical protein n=1 Tax=Bacteroides sp. ET71 TaxID=2939421 RepID=UPI002013BF28|nr:hypothetical protein [Bacteroides sp. ET71]MCL1615491.1 hypothetical protein [Bacteroides sp. ET71]